MSKFYTILAALVLSFTTATAQPVVIDNIMGIWTDANPGGAADGIGTNEIRWGTPAGVDDDDGGGQRSGYKFTPFMPQPLNTTVGADFTFGKFTHFNFPITGTPITDAELTITSDITIDGTLFDDVSFTYMFNHDETPNNTPNPEDIVTFGNPPMSQALDVNGQLYLLEIVGFQIGGQTLDEFITEENMANKAYLVGRIAAVPEPSTYLLLGSLLLACTVLRNRARATV